MPYSQFTTLSQVKAAFDLSTQTGPFLPDLAPIAPSPTLTDYLEQTLPVAIATGSEKARSELLIAPVLIEVRRIVGQNVSLFSGEEFTVDSSVGLNGRCDFLLSRSAEMMTIEAPAVVIVEAKQADLKSGLGQCMAEMVAAQRFNAAQHHPLTTLYGSVTNGVQWQFLKLEQQTVTIDLTLYPLPPLEEILSFFVWMVQND